MDGDIQSGSIGKDNKWTGNQTFYYSDGSIENKTAKGKKQAVKEPKQALFGTGKAKNRWMQTLTGDCTRIYSSFKFMWFVHLS